MGVGCGPAGGVPHCGSAGWSVPSSEPGGQRGPPAASSAPALGSAPRPGPSMPGPLRRRLQGDAGTAGHAGTARGGSAPGPAPRFPAPPLGSRPRPGAPGPAQAPPPPPRALLLLVAAAAAPFPVPASPGLRALCRPHRSGPAAGSGAGAALTGQPEAAGLRGAAGPVVLAGSEPPRSVLVPPSRRSAPAEPRSSWERDWG